MASPPTGDEIVADAKRYLGVPYVFGGGPPANPRAGLDCSGLVEQVAFDVGIHSCPRTSEEQYAWGIHITSPSPGDLVFFVGAPEESGTPGHVGIVTSPGHMIDAPHTGTVVQESGYSTNGTGENGFMGYRRMQGASSSPGSPSSGTTASGNVFIDEAAAGAASIGFVGMLLIAVLLVVVVAGIIIAVIVLHV